MAQTQTSTELPDLKDRIAWLGDIVYYVEPAAHLQAVPTLRAAIVFSFGYDDIDSVNLKVLTFDEYIVNEVPWDKHGAPRTWRHRDDG